MTRTYLPTTLTSFPNNISIMILHGLGLSTDGYTLSIVLAIATALAVTYAAVFPVRMDPKEPPIFRPRVPFIGHLLGLISLSHGYHRSQLSVSPSTRTCNVLTFSSRKHNMPICTLPILGGKLYVINSPDLAHSAILSRTLNFEPYVADFIRKMTDVGDAAMKKYEDPAFFSQWIKIVYSSLTGEHLLAVNSAAVKVMASSLSEVPPGGINVPDLFVWMRNLMTLASTTSLFGSKNPWRLDSRLFDAYWYVAIPELTACLPGLFAEHRNRVYESELVKMMLNIVPKMTSPKGYEGRVLMQKAMTEYFAAEYDAEDDVAKFTRDRMKLERSFGMTPSDMAAMEVAIIHGALSNTIPTAYWMLLYVFSNPELVAELRAEAGAVVKETGRSKEGQREVAIDVVRLEEKCPLLFSTLRETQRVISIGVLNRRVMADTVITDGTNSYLLKEGNNLQISHGVTHNREDIWGSNVLEFDGARFLRDIDRPSTTKSEDGLSVKPGAYTPFGGGKHICPGRFFASGEILGFMVPMLLGFEVTDMEGGVIRVPEASLPWITTPLSKPVNGADLSARLRRRAGWENVVWTVAR